MPLVNISVPAGKSREFIKAVGESINAAVISAMDFPANDRFQIIHEIPEDGLQYQGRAGCERVMMFLIMRGGRSDSQKKAFYKTVTENLAQSPGINPENVLITIVENGDIDWSFAGGVASFIDGSGI